MISNDYGIHTVEMDFRSLPAMSLCARDAKYLTGTDDQGSGGDFVADAQRLTDRYHARAAAEGLTPMIVVGAEDRMRSPLFSPSHCRH